MSTARQISTNPVFTKQTLPIKANTVPLPKSTTVPAALPGSASLPGSKPSSLRERLATLPKQNSLTAKPEKKRGPKAEDSLIVSLEAFLKACKGMVAGDKKYLSGMYKDADRAQVIQVLTQLTGAVEESKARFTGEKALYRVNEDGMAFIAKVLQTTHAYVPVKEKGVKGKQFTQLSADKSLFEYLPTIATDGVISNEVAFEIMKLHILMYPECETTVPGTGGRPTTYIYATQEMREHLSAQMEKITNEDTEENTKAAKAAKSTGKAKKPKEVFNPDSFLKARAKIPLMNCRLLDQGNIDAIKAYVESEEVNDYYKEMELLAHTIAYHQHVKDERAKAQKGTPASPVSGTEDTTSSTQEAEPEDETTEEDSQ